MAPHPYPSPLPCRLLCLPHFPALPAVVGGAPGLLQHRKHSRGPSAYRLGKGWRWALGWQEGGPWPWQAAGKGSLVQSWPLRRGAS